jgi:hypothetical protein
MTIRRIIVTLSAFMRGLSQARIGNRISASAARPFGP